MDDTSLLRSYVDDRSDAAFTALVERHVHLVYFAALRQTRGDSHRAQEIAQTVFTRLAQKAAGLTRHPALAGWLHATTRWAARELQRSETRRVRREHEAHAMKEISPAGSREADWEEVRPVIDEALGELAPPDQTAVLLRFFENRPYAEIGAALHLNENSARMRVDRALEKLRAALAKRGVTSTTTALTAALAVPSAAAVPAGLAQQLATAALGGAAAAGAGGAAIALFHFMTSAKITALSAAAALLAMGVAVQQHQKLEATRTEFAALRTHQTKQQALVDNLEWRLAVAQERAAKAESGSAAVGAAASTAVGGGNAATPPSPITKDMVEARLKKARELAKSGDYDAALKEYLWCYDTGMRQVEGYFLVRYSSLLESIRDLGKNHPPALDALRQRRDAAKNRLLASPNDLEAGKDFGQINRMLGEDAQTTALFDSLGEDDPRRGYLIEANMGRLVEAQRYREFAKAMPYPGLCQAWEQMTQVARSPAQGEAGRAAMTKTVVNFAATQIEVRAGAGDLVDASDMIERLLVFDNSPATVAAIKQHLARAGHPELVNLP